MSRVSGNAMFPVSWLLPYAAQFSTSIAVPPFILMGVENNESTFACGRVDIHIFNWLHHLDCKIKALSFCHCMVYLRWNLEEVVCQDLTLMRHPKNKTTDATTWWDKTI